MAHEWKVYQYLVEVLLETDGNARATQVIVEYVEDQSTRTARVTQAIIEYVEDWSTRFARVTQVIIEVAEKNVIPRGYLDEASAGNFTY